MNRRMVFLIFTAVWLVSCGDDDPAEQHNLLEEYPDMAARLADLLNEQRNKGRTR